MRPTPRSTNVMGKVIPIAQIAKLDHKGDDCYGIYDPDYPIISITKEMGHERRCETLLHECLHAIFNATYIGSSLAEHEEEVVQRLAPALLSWLRANRPLIEFLTEKP